MITINDLEKIDGVIAEVTYSKRNYKEETTIYGNTHSNYTSRGKSFTLDLKNLEKDFKNKLIELFYSSDSISIYDNETKENYSNMRIQGSTLGESKVLDRDSNKYLYNISVNIEKT